MNSQKLHGRDGSDAAWARCHCSCCVDYFKKARTCDAVHRGQVYTDELFELR